MTVADVTLIGVILITYSLAAYGGYIIGRNERQIRDRIRRIDNELRTQRTEEDGSSIIETTPQLIRKKTAKGVVDTDESAIVSPKTPQELRKAKETKLNEELDRITS